MNSKEPPEEEPFGQNEVISAWMLAVFVLTAISLVLS